MWSFSNPVAICSARAIGRVPTLHRAASLCAGDVPGRAVQTLRGTCRGDCRPPELVIDNVKPNPSISGASPKLANSMVDSRERRLRSS